MKIERRFSLEVQDEIALQRGATFLLRSGYRQVQRSPGGATFRRGSLLGTLTSFDPRHWSCDLRISTRGATGSGELKAEAEITSDPSERRYGEELITAEFNLLEAALTADHEVNSFDVTDLKRRISLHVYRIVGLCASIAVPAVLAVFVFTLAMGRLNATTAWAVSAATFCLAAAICLVVWRKLTRPEATG